MEAIGADSSDFSLFQGETGYETESTQRKRFETLLCCLSLYVPILSMTDKKCHNFWSRAQISTRFWHHTPQTLYWQYGWCHHHVMMLVVSPGGKNGHYCVPNTSPWPKGIVSKFHWNWPRGYETMLHDSSLKDCFLQWPQNTILHTPSATPPSFNWNTMEQYDDFQLFHKSVESWFTLQNIPVETPADPTVEPNSTQLEYVLNFNFLANTGCKKFDC